MDEEGDDVGFKIKTELGSDDEIEVTNNTDEFKDDCKGSIHVTGQNFPVESTQFDEQQDEKYSVPPYPIGESEETNFPTNLPDEEKSENPDETLQEFKPLVFIVFTLIY